MTTFIARSPQAAAVDALFGWHTREGAFERLQPPWDPAEIVERTGEGLTPGSSVTVRTHVAGVPQTLVAEHTRLVPNALFEDVQRQGPFASWVHQHRFRAIDPAHAELEDHVDYTLPLGAPGRLVGGQLVRERLERMFRFRHQVVAWDLARHAEADLSPRTVLVAGASGMLGSALTPFLTTGGHRVRRLVRRRARGADEVAWDPAKREIDPAALEGVDAVINLAGASLADGRWTLARKELLVQSRVDSTRTLAEALARAPNGPHGARTFISVSGAGYYGHTTGETPLTETAPPGDDFLARLAVAWEDQARVAGDAGVRVIHPRLGVVVTARGGVLGKLLLPFRMGVGGRLGSGSQVMSFVALEDVLGAFLFALADQRVRGPVNLVSPAAVTNAEFTRTLARVLKRPAIMPLPAFALKGALGELGEVALLGGQRAVPAALTAWGFKWRSPSLEETLRFELGLSEGPVGMQIPPA